ncbi:MAG: hypothetical protein ACHQ1D_00570 [Nitrososphaerales archaeon]
MASLKDKKKYEKKKRAHEMVLRRRKRLRDEALVQRELEKIKKESEQNGITIRNNY